MNGLLKEKKTVVVIGAVGAVVLLAAAWFLVIAPQQSKADDLNAQVTAAQNELSQRRTELATPAEGTSRHDEHGGHDSRPQPPRRASQARLHVDHPGPCDGGNGVRRPARRCGSAGPVLERFLVPR